MAVAVQSIKDVEKIVQASNQMMMDNPANFPIETNDRALLSWVLSDGNRTAADNAININLGKDLLKAAMESGTGDGKTALFTVRRRHNTRNRHLQPFPADYTTFTGEETSLPVQAQLEANGRPWASASFYPRTCSNVEPLEVQLAHTLRKLYADFNADVYAYLIREIARRKSDGTFLHIGNSPSRNADVGYAPGRAVKIFEANGKEPNREGIIGLQQELSNAGMSGANSAFAWGGHLWDSFARTIGGFRQGALDGFVYSTLNTPFLNEGSFTMNTDISTAFEEEGIQNPLLVIKPGALQLLTVATWKNQLLQTDTGSQIRSTIVVPGYGIEANMVVRIDDKGEYPVWHFLLTCVAAVFTMPGCISTALSDDFLKDYNGLMLYSGTCGDSNFCEAEPFVRRQDTQAAPYQNDCEPKIDVCDGIGTCSVSLRLAYNADGSLLLSADAVPKPPAQINGYAWTQNGNPLAVGNNKDQFVLGANDWTPGDVFEVTISDTGNCTSSSTATASSPFPLAEVLYDATPQPNGTKIIVNAIKTTGGQEIVELIIRSQEAGKPLSVDGVSLTNNNSSLPSSYTGVPAPSSLPVSVGQGTPPVLTLEIIQDLDSSGTIDHTLVFTSDDQLNPVYTVVVQIVIV